MTEHVDLSRATQNNRITRVGGNAQTNTYNDDEVVGFGNKVQGMIHVDDFNAAFYERMRKSNETIEQS